MAYIEYEMKTASQIAELAEKGEAIVVLPIGAIEQHGPHLPVGTDYLISSKYARKALEKVSLQAEYLLLPPIIYGLSIEHIHFPGTITLSAETFLHMLVDIGESLLRTGIKKLVIINGHGGNNHIIQIGLRELKLKGMKSYFINTDRMMERLGADCYSIHADKIETSVMMALYPENVEESMITPDLDKSMECWDKILDNRGDVIETWLTKDFAVDGVIGNPFEASQEFGEEWIDGMVEQISTALELVARAE